MGYLPPFSISAEIILYRLLHFICTILQAERLSYQRQKGKERLNNASRGGKLLFQLDKICKDIGIHNTNPIKSTNVSSESIVSNSSSSAAVIISNTPPTNTASVSASVHTAITACTTPQQAMQQIHFKINEFQEYYSNLNQPNNILLKFPENFPKILSSADVELNESQLKSYQLISDAVYKVSSVSFSMCYLLLIMFTRDSSKQ